MKVAAAKYVVQAPASFDAFAARLRGLLGEARSAGAEWAVLPEYLALELAAMFPPSIRGDLAASMDALQPWHDAWLSLFADLSRELDLVIQAGTFLLRDDSGRYRNRAWLFEPGGRRWHQDKLQLTAFEKRTEMIVGGEEVKVLQVNGVRTGIAVCYDSEFPLPVRAQREAGARLLLVPSCTDTAAGATRVSVGCMARALENRVFVAKAVTAGIAEWSPALDVNTGEAAIHAPMDDGFPADGVLSMTAGDQIWAIADVDCDALESSRPQAQVSIDRDWNAQLRPAMLRARVEE